MKGKKIYPDLKIKENLLGFNEGMREKLIWSFKQLKENVLMKKDKR